jgi:F-type H+-transporting ATPase subunit b
MDLQPQPEVVGWTIATFLALLILLARFALKPLKRALSERERIISDSLDKAHHAQAEAEKILGLNEKQLAGARDEARKIISEGHRIVSQMKREAHEAGKREADALVVQARADIDREFQRSLAELKGTVANLSIRISRQIMQENLDDDRHKDLADNFIDRLKKSHAARRN